MAKSKYSEEFKSKIVTEYKNGKIKNQIKKEYNISFSTMNHWINNQYNIDVGNVKYSDDIVQKVLKDYCFGDTAVTISKRYLIKSGTIYSWIKKANISRKKGIPSLCKNETYFDNIDTELKAYFLGFIIADGNVSIQNNQYAFKISLQRGDRCVIEKLVEELMSENHIRDFKQKSSASDKIYKYSYVSIGNKHLVESLIKLKVIPSKTFHEEIPVIKDSLLKHLIRGFFDGDGIACKTQKSYSFGFVGNEYILNQIKDILQWNNALNPNVNTDNLFTIMTTDKKKLFKFYHYMYDDATFFLKRKHDKLKAIVDLVPS